MAKKVDLNARRQSNHNGKRSNHNFNMPQYNNVRNSIQQADNNPVEEETSTGLNATIGMRRKTELPDRANIEIKIPLKVKIIFTALLIGIPFILLLLFVVIFGIEDSVGGGKLSFGGYYTSKCPEITVIEVDKNNGYTPIGSNTYNIEDYVAGVVSAEVGGLKHIELYKVYALAARTFVLRNVGDDCSIENSARRQVFKDITESTTETAKLIYQAVEETAGQVILSENNLYPVQYDAFCYKEKDSTYYTLSQQNQKIPVDWATSHVWSKDYLNCPCDLKDKSMTECWNANGTWKDGGHGRGMSQYGAYYLATEKGYTYDEILNFYYGDSISVSSQAVTTSIAGLEIKDTTKASYTLKQPITEFLSSKGSSLDDMNNFIRESVIENGAGTREGVVTAAVSMINYLYDNFDAKLPYYWGGRTNQNGIPQSFGTYAASPVSRGGNVNYYKSFDCSGFVSWAIRNGGYNFSNYTTSSFDSTFSKNSCDITSSSCIGGVGDLINSKNGHVELIIAVDEANGKYFVAHSSGPGVVMAQRNMHAKNSSNTTKIIYMEEFYSNASNVNPNY